MDSITPERLATHHLRPLASYATISLGHAPRDIVFGDRITCDTFSVDGKRIFLCFCRTLGLPIARGAKEVAQLAAVVEYGCLNTNVY
jgi:hypothetical protein